MTLRCKTCGHESPDGVHDCPGLGAPPADDAIERRRKVIQKFGIGWVETGFFPNDRYRIDPRMDGWAVFTEDEQQAGWDTAHVLLAEPDCGCGMGDECQEDTYGR